MASFTLPQIDAEIRHTLEARQRAIARRKHLLAAQLLTKVQRLRRQRALLLGRVASRRTTSRGTPVKVSFWSRFSRGAGKPPRGVRDPYAGVEPNQKNAPTLAAFYYAKSRKAVLTRAARAYFLLRLEQVKPFLPHKTGPAKMMEAAKAHRRMAARAAMSRNTAAATRLASQAEVLEQKARSMAIQGAMPSTAQEIDAEIEDVPPGEVTSKDTAPESAEASSAEGSAVTEGSEASESPWYKRPLVWGVGVAALVGLAAFSGKGKGGRSSSSFTKKSFVLTSSPRRSGGKTRSPSTSLTRSL